MNASAALASLTLLDLDEQPVPLAELWADRPTVFAFLRHFG
jgi:hypothetical protein